MVARVVFPFRGERVGGSHVAAFTLARALRQRHGVDCICLCPVDTEIMAYARASGLDVAASDEPPTGRNNLVSDISHAGRRRRRLAMVAGSDPAVVHCNDINTLRAWGRPARTNGHAVVYHHHALNKLWWPPHLAALARADEVICVSDLTLSEMQMFRPRAQKELNPFEMAEDIDRSAARNGLIAEFNWPSNVRIIGWAGNFWKRKRPDFFLHVAARIAAEDDDARFVMFGRDGDWRADVIARLGFELGLHGKLALPGFRQPAENNLAAMDLLLAPAPREPFGRTLVEALLVGTPYLATSGAGHSEIQGNWAGGGLAPPQADAGDFAFLALAILARPQALTLSLDRRRLIARELAPAAHAERILAIYRQLDRRVSATAGKR